jgi:hypothetical protein
VLQLSLYPLALVARSVWGDKDTPPVLYAFCPKSNVLSAVRPLKDAEAFFFVLIVIASELAAIAPSEHALALHVVARPLTCVLVFWRPDKGAFAVHFSIEHVPHIHAAISPFENARAVFLFTTYKTVEFVRGTDKFVLLPEALLRWTVWIAHFALSVHFVVEPVAIVTSSIGPQHRALPLS